MTGPSSRNDVVQEISLLYELALAIGTSLDLEANCETFLKTLVARKNLDFAAVWLRARHLKEQPEEPGYHAVSGCPAFRMRAGAVPLEPRLEALAPGDFITLQAGSPGFDDFAPGGVGVEGTTALLPVGQLGLLQLFTREPGGFSDRELEQLRNVLRTFATSVEGCIAHRRLRTEVTERRRTAASLRAVTSRLRALITNMQAGVIVEDEDQHVVLVNQTFCDLFGLEATPQELVGRGRVHTSEQVQRHMTAPQEFVRSREALLAEREVVTGEELQLRDGRVLERDYVPIYSEGALRGHLWQYRDVTERKRAEQEVVRLKNFYEQVLDRMPVQLAVFDTEGRYQYVTPSSVSDPDMRAWLRGRTDVDYCRHRDLDPSVGPERLDALRRVARTQEEHVFEESFQGRDGQEYHFLRVITPVVEEGRTVRLLGYGLDITERERAERALQASEARYKQLVEEANDVIYQADTDGRFTYVNPTALRVTGYSEEDVLGMRVFDLVRPDMRQAVWLFYTRQVRQQQDNSYLELPIVARDGEELWFGQNVRLLRDDDGRLLGFQGLARDVTQRKRSEAALRESEERFEEVLRSLDAVVWSISIPDERLLYINPAAKRLYGRPVEAFEEDLWTWLHAVHPDDLGRMEEHLEYFLAEGTSEEAEYRVVRPDGGVRWVSDRHRVVRDDDGRPLRVSGFVTDITDRKRAEEELRESEERFEEVLRSLDAVVWSVSLVDERMLYINPAAEQVYGYPTEAFVEDLWLWLKVVHPEDREGVRAAMDRFDHGLMAQQIEYRIVRPDGEVRWVYNSHAMVRDDDGRPLRVSGFVTDITDRKRAEEELTRIRRAVEVSSDAVAIADGSGRIIFRNQAFVDLLGFTADDFAAMSRPEDVFVDAGTGREIVDALMGGRSWMGDVEMRTSYGSTLQIAMRADALTNEAGQLIGIIGILTDVTERKEMEEALRRAKQAAEASAEAKERFLANVSHEMRTPLNAVVGMTHLLRATDPSPEQERYLDGIRFSTDNLLVLINDLLDIAKLEAGKVEFETVPFDLAALLQQLDDTMQIRAREKGLCLRVEPDEALPSVVQGDPTRLSQVLLNLVSNALKFTEEGEVVVRAAPATQDGAPAVRFEVEDTGIGISAEQLDRIFQSFTQAGSDTTRKYGGTGLGLAIVKELVERQGGRIEVASSEGAGTTFTVLLPMAPAEQVVSTGDGDGTEADEATLEGRSLLLVEDNEMSRIVTARMLRHWGAEVDVASGGQEALDRVAEQAYDLVLMDIQMPGMDGVEATRRIREDLGRTSDELPIVALTAASLSDQRRAAIEAAGIDDFVFKPFEPEALRRRIAFRLGATLASASQQELDLAMLERNAFGDNRFVIRMIDMFCSSVPADLGAMQEAADRQDWEQVRFLAHKMKSTAGMVGADALRAVMLEIEEQVDAGRTEGLPALVERAVQRGARALEVLEARRTSYA